MILYPILESIVAFLDLLFLFYYRNDPIAYTIYGLLFILFSVTAYEEWDDYFRNRPRKP